MKVSQRAELGHDGGCIAATVHGMETGDTNVAAGWYGKLPSLGDFASRRLDHGFIEAWDQWLAEGLAEWREREPDLWLERYLACPSWRFVLAPGALDRQGCWVGVLMPSVDRVGRYFPLTLALPLPGLPSTPSASAALLSWLQRLDDLALDALDEDWSADQLEVELQRLGLPAPLATSDDLRPEDTLQYLKPGHALWICCDANGEPRRRATGPLPRGPEFDTLLGASVLLPIPDA
jgi:type VI secretion system protein ImpM